MPHAIPALPQLSPRTRFTRHPVARIVAGIACVLLPLVLAMALAQHLVAREWRPAWHYLLSALLCLAGFSSSCAASSNALPLNARCKAPPWECWWPARRARPGPSRSPAAPAGWRRSR